MWNFQPYFGHWYYEHFLLTLRRLVQDLIYDKSTLVQVMAWCCQATSHYLNQCWLGYMMLCSVNRRKWLTTLSLSNWQFLFRLNTLRPRQNGRHFPDDIFKWILLNENVWISINNSLKFVPRGPINNITTLVQVMAWRRPGDKPLSEPMMVRLPTHICVTRPQWVN